MWGIPRSDVWCHGDREMHDGVNMRESYISTSLSYFPLDGINLDAGVASGTHATRGRP